MSSTSGQTVEGRQQARLRELAFKAALDDHEWFFDGSITMLPPKNKEGHERNFDTCPHPDCVLVRAASSPRQTPEPAAGKE